MLSTEENRLAIPPKTKSAYQDFNLINETASYRVFEANSRNSGERHTIRVLDSTKAFVDNDFDMAATFFIQELLYLQNRCPGSIFINTLEINKDLKQVACAIHPCGLLSLQLQEIQESINLKDPKVIEKLLNDVISDVEFLWRDLRLRNIKSIVNPENIYYLKKNEAFFLGNWSQILETKTQEPENEISRTDVPEESKLNSRNLAAEIEAVAFGLLKIKKVDLGELEHLRASSKVSAPVYNHAVKSAVSEGFKDVQSSQDLKDLTERLQNLVERMFSRDPVNLPNLEECKIKEENLQDQHEKFKKEANLKQEIERQTLLEKLKINPSSNLIIESTPQRLLVWCSQVQNKISVMDLEAKQEYAHFEGVQLKDTGNSWTHVKEIPNTNLLISLHHNQRKSANMQIFDISNKGQVKSIFCIGEVNGVTGEGDVTYNTQRNILGAVSLEKQIAYHLLTIDANASSTNDIVKLTRKSKWQSQSSNENENWIAGLGFNPTGDSIATIDRYGMCLISDVTTDNYILHLKIGSKADSWSRCRWSSNGGEPLLFVKYNENLLNILDVEKKALILTDAIKLEQNFYTYWIDVCPIDGNLLASVGCDQIIKIFDKRESKLVITFNIHHSGDVLCVRWSSNGKMIASSSSDGTARLFDIKACKFIQIGKTSDRRKMKLKKPRNEGDDTQKIIEELSNEEDSYLNEKLFINVTLTSVHIDSISSILIKAEVNQYKND